jgi:rod shape-determining protein MreD
VIPTPGAFLRLGLLILAVIVLQVSAMAELRVLGGSADLVPLLVAAVALYGGSVAGAATGFTTGLLLDLALGQTLGASSLVLSAVGYGVGRFREVRDPSHGLVAIPVAAAATAGWVTAFAAVSFMLEFEASVSALVFREMLVTIVLNTVLALPFFALVRRVMRSAFAVDPTELRRRRRAPRESGPIGLRGLEV